MMREAWLEAAYTRRLLHDLDSWCAKALGELRVAAAKSTDPVVRGLSATYEAHMKVKGQIAGQKEEEF